MKGQGRTHLTFCAGLVSLRPNCLVGKKCSQSSSPCIPEQGLLRPPLAGVGGLCVGEAQALLSRELSQGLVAEGSRQGRVMSMVLVPFIHPIRGIQLTLSEEQNQKQNLTSADHRCLRFWFSFFFFLKSKDWSKIIFSKLQVVAIRICNQFNRL